MQQLGASFINSFLLPYLQDFILADITQNSILEKLFKEVNQLTTEELTALEYGYDYQRSILYEDEDLRKAFWKEFVEFVNRQKKLCKNDFRKLSYRLLPDKGEFSDIAKKNLQKFSFYVVNRLEDTLIRREIEKDANLGIISSAQYSNNKDMLKEGKLLMVQRKDGKFNYMSDKEIANAIGNVEKASGIFKDMKTEKAEDGEERLFTMNPFGEDETVSLYGLQELSWEKQLIIEEKKFEDNGIYIDGHMKIDANGNVHGEGLDGTGARLIIEFNIAKPGARNYTMYLAIDPGRKFLISERELNEEFGKKGRSASDIFSKKPGYEVEIAQLKGKGFRPSERPTNIVLPKGRRVSEMPISKKTPDMAIGVLGTGTFGSRYGKGGKVVEQQDNIAGYEMQQNLAAIGGINEIKRKFEERRLKERKNKGIQIQIKSPNRKNPEKAAKEKANRGKKFIFQIMKYYAAALGGTGFLAILSSFFTE